MSFKKDDTGKPSFSLIAQFSKELGDVNKVLEYGASKYGRDNWKQADSPADLARYLDALVRHVLAARSGEVLDTESGLPHLDHALANALFVQNILNSKQVKKENKLDVK